MNPYPVSGSSADRGKTSDQQAASLVPGAASVAGWDKENEGSAKPGADSGAIPPVWSRYIDSRLKQFCTR